ncbi:hypothetical protein ACFW9D_05425 [Streptomyces sp. NPDC059524]|uniref:hypothetical protein n=1 Tax=Streptomyces sp. NPDC059524 TaxID=3346856 RepID=UPI0036C24DF0
MGRKKPGKPRRPRVPRQYTLKDLAPPGFGYDEWLRPAPGADLSSVNDPRLSTESIELMRRVQRISTSYNGLVPVAAIHLDMLIDDGQLPIFQGDSGNMIPIEEMAAAQGSTGTEAIREAIHNLHAHGALMVFQDEEHEAIYVRMVAQRPEEPGDAWKFAGDPDAVVASTCIPDHIWKDLPQDVAAAVVFMRSCRSRLEEPDPEVYGTHESVNGTEHAKELFAAALASGAVDEKGCEACPCGHLCTRSGAE